MRLCTAAGVGVLAIGGAVALDFQHTKEQQSSQSGVPVPEEAIAGLPLGSLEEEINLDAWYRLADYDFERGSADDMGNQEDLILDAGANVEDGMLRLSGFDDFAVSNLKRTWSTAPKALAVNILFLPEAYLAPGNEDTILFEFSLHWKQGVFLQSSKWGDPLPTFQIERRQPMAPPGVIEPKFAAGQWHDVWIVMSDSYRLWIDGVPIYRTRESAGLDNWERWKGDQGVTLKVQGFRGKVDHIRVWEQK